MRGAGTRPRSEDVQKTDISEKAEDGPRLGGCGGPGRMPDEIWANAGEQKTTAKCRVATVDDQGSRGEGGVKGRAWYWQKGGL